MPTIVVSKIWGRGGSLEFSGYKKLGFNHAMRVIFLFVELPLFVRPLNSLLINE
jgi:hypothetical protein